MPERILQRELRGFLMRVVATLASRSKVLRQQGRDTLAKVVLEVGWRGALEPHASRIPKP